MSTATQIYVLELKDQNGNTITDWDASLYSDGSGTLPTKERILAAIYEDIADNQDIALAESQRSTT